MARTYLDVINYLSSQDIHVDTVDVLPSCIDPLDKINGIKISELPIAKQMTRKLSLQETGAQAMSLASMSAVRVLDLNSGQKVLDVCSAPGMKALYANLTTKGLEYFVNDVSAQRLTRLSRLLTQYGINISQITRFDGRFIDRAYEHQSFDRILIDAPCSGEGVILGGNQKLLDTWSPAKVKRLQQLQIGILKSSWKLLAPGGRLVYATCTLNKNENERVIKKALGLTVEVTETPLDIANPPLLSTNHAVRILPSSNSIGFFICALDKNVDLE